MLEAFKRTEPSALPEMNQEQFLGNVEALLQQGVRIGVAADFDGNISVEGSTGGLDPRESSVDPRIRQAFQSIIESGHDVIIISSRGAQDVATRVGLESTTSRGTFSAVGTLGWETRDPEGKSHIHEQFAPYKDHITTILRSVREQFIRNNVEPDQQEAVLAMAMEPNMVIPTPFGEVILQPKGYTNEEGYPEGINHTWALNMVPPEQQAQFAEALTQYYEDAFANVASAALLTSEQRHKLDQLCGFVKREGVSMNGKPLLDIEIRPRSQGAKAHAGLQLLRSDGREQYMTNMPRNQILIYSGDHIDQDWPVGRAGHLADRLTHGQAGIINVWTRQHQEEPGNDTRGIDIVVDGVNGNAQLLTRLAELFARYPQTQAA